MSGPLDALDIELALNGEVMQSASTADLVHSIPALLSHLLRLMTLEPGDIVFTGTPGGRGQPAPAAGLAQAGRRAADLLAQLGRLETRLS